MPVLLDEEDEDRWLTCSFDDAVALAKPFPSQLMTARQDASTGTTNSGDGPLFA